MMDKVEAKYGRLVDSLLRLTIHKQIKWEQSSRGYQCALENNFVEIIEGRSAENTPVIIIRILDIFSSEIDSFDDEDLEKENAGDGYGTYWEKMKDLHQNAKRSATGADEAIDSILNELSDKEIPF